MIKEAYDKGEWCCWLPDTPYSRQKLTAFKQKHGVDYRTIRHDGLMVVFVERLVELALGE